MEGESRTEEKRVNPDPDSLLPTTDIVDPQQTALFDEQSPAPAGALDAVTAEERLRQKTNYFEFALNAG